MQGCTNAAGAGCAGAAVTISYRYDAANRLIEETSPSDTTTLDYDPNSGRLAQLTDGNSHEGFGYDDQGRLIQHSRHIDGHRFITRYAYNAKGKLSQKTLPDGQTLSYHYYSEGTQKGLLRAITRKRLMGLSEITLVGEIDQDPSDGQTGLTFGNGLRETRHHDKLGRTTAIDHSKQLKLQYQYDEQGRITGIDYNGMLQSYDYDLLGRLTRAETALGSYRYDYDSLGNRTQKQHTDPAGNTTTQQNQYPDPGEGNRLLSQENAETQSYRYNPSGSPEQIGERHYEYDAHQRPVRLYRVDPNDPENKTLVAEYAYNRFGERIKKVTYNQSKKPKVTYYLYDGHQLTAEANETGKVTTQYLYQHQRPILKLEGKDAYAVHTDHLGAPRAVTNEDGEQVWSVDYSPFGLIDIQVHEITLNIRLPGQYEDQEAGTYYNYHRNYDPHTGRFLTSDPIGLKGGLNTYAYVGGNPLNTIDPLGLYWEMVDGQPSLVIGDDPPMTTFIENARNNGQLTDEQAQLAHEGYLNIPKPSANSPFVQKLQAVFSEAAFQLAENPAYNGNAGLIAFAQLLQQDAPMIAGMMAAFAAIQFLPPPWNVGIDSLLIATGMTMVGIDGVQLIAYLLRMALEIDDTDICDGERLQV